MRLRAIRFAVLACVGLVSGCASHAVAPVPSGLLQFQRAVAAPGSRGTNGGTVYPMGDASSETGFVMDFSLGADGQIYYASTPAYNNGWSTTGEIGLFNPSTHAQSYQLISYDPGFIQETSDGSVWVTEDNNLSGTPTVDRYAGFNGPDARITMGFSPITPGFFGNGIDGGLAIGRNGNIWIGSNNSGQVGVIDPSDDNAQIFNLNVPAGGVTPTPQFMTFISDGSLWLTDAANTGAYRVTAGGPSIGKNTFYALPEKGRPSTSVQGIVQGADSKIYTADTAYATGWLDSSPYKTPQFNSLSLPAIGTSPYVFARFKSTLYFLDYHFDGIGKYNVATHKLVILPLVTWSDGNLVVDSSGMLWTSCYLPTSATSCIQNVPITSTWEPFPSRSIKLYTNYNNEPNPPGLIGIGETGNSGPFTVKAPNPSICTAAMTPKFDHDVQVNPVATGSCSVVITDAHNRSVAVSVHIMKGSGLPQLRIGRSLFNQTLTEGGN